MNFVAAIHAWRAPVQFCIKHILYGDLSVRIYFPSITLATPPLLAHVEGSGGGRRRVSLQMECYRRMAWQRRVPCKVVIVPLLHNMSNFSQHCLDSRVRRDRSLMHVHMLSSCCLCMQIFSSGCHRGVQPVWKHFHVRKSASTLLRISYST